MSNTIVASIFGIVDPARNIEGYPNPSHKIEGNIDPFDELMSNPGFETAGAGGADIWASWVETAGDGTLANETTLIRGGLNAAKITAGATANTQIAQTYTAIPGHRYHPVIWSRTSTSSGGRFRIYDVSNSADIIATTQMGGSTTAYFATGSDAYDFLAPAGCTSVRLDLMCPPINLRVVYFDDISLTDLSVTSSLIQNVLGTVDITGKIEASPNPTGNVSRK